MDRVLFEKPNHERLVKNFNVVDMHSHTEASHDCGTSLKDYADKLKSLKIGAAITDHDEISASLAFKRNYPKIFLIPGIEATSVDNKHILFYFGKHSDLQDFYNKHIMHHKKKHKTNTFRIRTTISTEELLDAAKDYGGLRVFAHPMVHSEGIYRSLAHKKDFSILKKAEGIEVLNSTQRFHANLKSLSWALLTRKSKTGGSDSHIIETLGSTVTLSHARTPESFLETIRKNKNHIIGHSNTFHEELDSLVEIIKNKMTLIHKH